ncbi:MULTISPECIES: GmrSD restriction endonuclease domain-containing protein [Streptomyces]|uniref:GmrSD restriction endonuclease domain-containing protein n=1 Tax=Streptomyces TaxID=1883 RepID=UPI00068EFF20
MVWYSAYDGKISTRPSTEVDIDHVVPLANGWRSGADEWTTAKRRQFANDLVNPPLIAVSASSDNEAGIITGDLTVRTTLTDDRHRATVAVQ